MSKKKIKNNQNIDKNIKYLTKNYEKVGHPIAYSSPGVIAKFLKSIHKDLPIAIIKETLSQFDSYNLFKEKKGPRAKYQNPYYVYSRREQIQADLIQISELSSFNDGVNHILVLIDTFSRKIWCYPLKTKSSAEVVNAFKNHFEKDADNIFFVANVDGGTEFFNKRMYDLLNKYSIHIELGSGLSKQAFVERVNKTIQILIYKYLIENETNRYIDVLDDIVKSYNTRPHRALNGMSPDNADLKENEVHVRGILRRKYANIKRMTKKEINEFKVGDIVRIRKITPKISSASRGYKPKFKGEYFIITRISDRMPRAWYFLRSMNDNEDILQGFYKNEISKVTGNVRKVEKILRSRNRKGKKEHFVKWKHFSSDFNSWIPDKDIVKTYE